MGLLAVPEDSKSMCQPAQRTARLSDELRKRCATAWRDARDEIGGGLGFARGCGGSGGGSWGGRGMLGVACRPSSPGYSGPFRGRN